MKFSLIKVLNYLVKYLYIKNEEVINLNVSRSSFQ